MKLSIENLSITGELWMDKSSVEDVRRLDTMQGTAIKTKDQEEMTDHEKKRNPLQTNEILSLQRILIQKMLDGMPSISLSLLKLK